MFRKSSSGVSFKVKSSVWSSLMSAYIKYSNKSSINQIYRYKIFRSKTFIILGVFQIKYMERFAKGRYLCDEMSINHMRTEAYFTDIRSKPSPRYLSSLTHLKLGRNVNIEMRVRVTDYDHSFLHN